jgi:hypothetical protein
LVILPDTSEKAEPVEFNDPNGLILINAIFAANQKLFLFFNQKKLAKAGIQEYII